MFGFSSIKLLLGGLSVLAIGAIVYAGYTHYNNLIDDIKRLERQNTLLDQQVKVQENSIAHQQSIIEDWDKAQEALKQELDNLDKLSKTSSKELDRLNEILSKHSLTKLAKSKPSLIEKRINNATRRTFRLHECATGNDASCGTPKN